ncbi:MAG: glutathione S-transferase family protein [Granulosicoccus sp.]
MKKLFGHPDSGHAFKIRFFLEVAKIQHDYEKVDIWIPRDQRSSEFQSVARFGEVPVLVDNGRAHVQSNAILLHLARQTRGWGAENPERLDLCTQWLMWEANKIGMCLPQLRSRAKFESDANLDAAYHWLTARYERDVNTIDAEFSDGREWILAGDTPSIADFSLSGYLFFAGEADLEVPVLVQDWLNRLSMLNGWQHPYDLLA